MALEAALFVLSIPGVKPGLGSDYGINTSVTGAASQVGRAPVLYGTAQVFPRPGPSRTPGNGFLVLVRLR